MTTIQEDYGCWTEETLNCTPFWWETGIPELDIVWDWDNGGNHDNG